MKFEAYMDIFILYREGSTLSSKNITEKASDQWNYCETSQ